MTHRLAAWPRYLLRVWIPGSLGLVLLFGLGFMAGARAQAPTPLLPPPLPPNAAPPPAVTPASPVPGAAPAITPPPSSVPPPVVTTMPGVGPSASTAAAGTPGAGASQGGLTPGVSASGHPLPSPTPAPPAPSWQPAYTAHIQILDKVNGRAETLAIAVGATGQYRTLTVTVRACDARPPDQPPDATALIVARRDGAAAPIYAGWLLEAEPTAAMVSDPVYDLRVTACT